MPDNCSFRGSINHREKLTSVVYFRNVQTKSPTLTHNLNPGPFGDNLNSSLKVRQSQSRVVQSRSRGLFRGVASPAILCHKEPTRASQAGFLACSSLILYGKRGPGPFRAWKPTILSNYHYTIMA